MTKILLYTVLALTLWFPHSGFGQIKTSVTSNNKLFDKAKSVEKDYKIHKKYLRDSLKKYRQLDRLYKKRADSLLAAIHISDELGEYGAIPEIDSIGGYRQHLQRQYEYYEAQALNQELYEPFKAQWPSDSLPQFSYTSDSLGYLQDILLEDIEAHASHIKGLETIQLEQKNLDLRNNELTAQKKEIESLQQPPNLRNSILKLNKVQTLTQNKSLNTVQNSIKKYKKKYESLSSINDIGKIKTKNSLSKLPLKQRLKVGGNLQIRHDQFVNIDFSPSIAYRITRKLSSGLEFVYRAEFGNGKEWYNAFNSKTYGGRLFTEYGLFKSFYAHAELERMISNSTEIIGQNNSEFDNKSLGIMAGVGKTFSLSGNVRGKVLLQYNFNYDDNNQIYSGPWIIRLGFEIKNLDKLFKKSKT